MKIKIERIKEVNEMETETIICWNCGKKIVITKHLSEVAGKLTCKCGATVRDKNA